MPRKRKNTIEDSKINEQGLSKAEVESPGPRSRKTNAAAAEVVPGARKSSTRRPSAFLAEQTASESGASNAFAEPSQVNQIQTDMGGASFSADVNQDPGASLHEQIALLAYFYWQAGGRRDGTSVDDWLRAEREVLARFAGSTGGEGKAETRH